MRVLITGGCGFIGSAVVRLAADRGDQILNIDRRRKSNPIPALASVATKPGYARLEADISDRTLMRAVFREFKPEAVIHLASAGEDLDENRLFDSEITGAFSVLEASRAHYLSLDEAGRQRFRIVHAQRADGDGAAEPTPIEAARASAAALFDNWSQAYRLPLVTCIADQVFGPWQSDASTLSRMIASLLAGHPFKLEMGGETVRDWLPVSDFASGLIRAAEAGAPLSRFEFSAGAERRDIDLAEAVCALLDTRSPMPSSVSWSSLIGAEGDGSKAFNGPMLDAGEAENQLGWRSRGFHGGLDRALNWGLTRYAPKRPAHAVAAE
jgi:dTDP-glucose 4,6-dehydratase